MNRLNAFLLFVLLAIPVAGAGAGLGPIEIAPQESGVQMTRFEKKKDALYNYSWNVKREGGRVVFSARGDNNKSGPKRIEWTENSVMELDGSSLRTLTWAKDSSGAEQESWKLTYDWAARKVNYLYQDRATGKTESKSVELGSRAFSSDAMYFMLRAFPFEQGTGTRIDGDFVLTNGQVLPAYIILRGEEKLTTPMGTFETYKLEMKLKGALGGIAPKMFMWFTKDKPHLFVRYDGKEAGLTSGRTVNELLKFTPAEWIKPMPAQTPAP